MFSNHHQTKYSKIMEKSDQKNGKKPKQTVYIYIEWFWYPFLYQKYLLASFDFLSLSLELKNVLPKDIPTNHYSHSNKQKPNWKNEWIIHPLQTLSTPKTQSIPIPTPFHFSECTWTSKKSVKSEKT